MIEDTYVSQTFNKLVKSEKKVRHMLPTIGDDGKLKTHVEEVRSSKLTT